MGGLGRKEFYDYVCVFCMYIHAEGREEKDTPQGDEPWFCADSEGCEVMICSVCVEGVSTLPRRKAQKPVGGAWSKPERSISCKSNVGGLSSSSGWGAEEAEQRALAEGCGGQSRCGKRLGWEDVGTRKPVPAAQACLHLLFSWVCAGLVGAVLHSLPDNIVEESKTGRCFPYSPCPEMAVTFWSVFSSSVSVCI